MHRTDFHASCIQSPKSQTKSKSNQQTIFICNIKLIPKEPKSKFYLNLTNKLYPSQTKKPIYNYKRIFKKNKGTYLPSLTTFIAHKKEIEQETIFFVINEPIPLERERERDTGREIHSFNQKKSKLVEKNPTKLVIKNLNQFLFRKNSINMNKKRQGKKLKWWINT